MKTLFPLLVLFLAALVASARAQETHSGDQHSMRQNHGEHSEAHAIPSSFVTYVLRHTGSGTSAQPNSTPEPMIGFERGPWMLMLHGAAFIDGIQQSGPRGGDKLFSTNWAMLMAQRSFGRSTLTLRTMLSLEPATVTGERYPLLFQQGETAYGRPIIDGQHPHNLFMELGAFYDLKLSPQDVFTLYAAPVGDPALGPMAYPHRKSAGENPVAPLGHHQQDSTHIAADVVTAGYTHGIARIEMSGFHGREPGENRWKLGQGAIDSWSARFTLQPGQNWSGQYSYSRITSPEALEPAEDQERMTASILYNRPLAHGNWASSLVWGRTRSLPANAKENSYLLESTLRFAGKNSVWTRVENAGRSTELLDYESEPATKSASEEPLAHVAAYTGGYDREIPLLPFVGAALGAQVTFYVPGDPLKHIYGDHPAGVNIFLHLWLKSGQ